LPARLLAQPGLRLRDNDPQFLDQVARWFGRILPIIREYQLGAAGTVIAVQIENELDFYNCADPAGYIASLRDLALGHGIEVPLIACAGQGDIPRATGLASAVVPTCNFYPSDRDLGIEALVGPYYTALSALDLPLCITETNRAHITLRRLLSCGAKLIGPYLQASGTNFGFTNAINNWGNPMALLTSDYDFGGMIGSAGEARAEVLEARLLSSFIAALGRSLAQAIPVGNSEIAIETDMPLVEGGPRVLALHGGGRMLALPNLNDVPEQVRVRQRDTTLPRYTACVVEPNQCPFLLFDLPLTQWRLAGTLEYTTAELCLVRVFDRCTVLAFHTDSQAEVSFVFPEQAVVETRGLTAFEEGNRVSLGFDRRQVATATIRLANGATLRVLALDRQLAGRLVDATAQGAPVFAPESGGSGARKAPAAPRIAWAAVEVADEVAQLAGPLAECGSTPKYLEQAGIMRGIGWYSGRIDRSITEQITGLLLHDASDILSVYWDNLYQGTVAPGGGCAYLPRRAGEVGASGGLIVRAEIWGHSNFDDARLPALRLDALKGLSGITAVLRERALGGNWQWYPQAGHSAPLSAIPDIPAPIVRWGRWITNAQPEAGVYLKTVDLSAEANAWVLHFAGLQTLVHVTVNGQPCGVVNPLNPYVDFSDYAQPGQAATIALAIERWHRQPAGDVALLEGRRATDWQIGSGGEAELWAAAERALPHAHHLELPHRLRAGALGWLFGDVGALARLGGSWVLRCLGRNAKVTAWFNGHIVGRLWLPASLRPTMVGGAPDVLQLPEPWIQPTNNRLALLVEAVEYGEMAEVSDLFVQPA